MALAESLERVTPGREGLGLSPSGSGGSWRSTRPGAPSSPRSSATPATTSPRRRSGGIADRTGVAVLRAFGLEPTPARAALVNNLISVLIRCSFYAEQIPADSSAQPWSKGWPNCSTASWPGRSRA